MKFLQYIISFLSIGIIVFLSGCITLPSGQQKIPYKDDVISIEHYMFYPAETYPNTYVTLDMLLQNNANVPIVVKFYVVDEGGTILENLTCGSETVKEKQCEMTIQPLDAEVVIAKFNTGEIFWKEKVIRFEIVYDYTGYSTLKFTVVDPERFKIHVPVPGAPYGGYELKHFYSPLKLEMQPEFAQVKSPTGTEFKGFAFKGLPTVVKMKFVNVGQTHQTVKGVSRAIVPLMDIEIKLNGLEDQTPGGCKDTVYESMGTIKTPIEEGELRTSEIWVEDESKEAICKFINTRFDEPMKDVFIMAKYSFKYDVIWEEKVILKELP